MSTNQLNLNSMNPLLQFKFKTTMLITVAFIKDLWSPFQTNLLVRFLQKELFNIVDQIPSIVVLNKKTNLTIKFQGRYNLIKLHN